MVFNYKPKNTPFGEIGIDKQQLIYKKYVKRENHVMGYLTGPSLWNAWNITTQLPNRTWIVTNAAKRNVDKDDLKVKLLKPKAHVTDDNYELMQFLDVMDQAFQIQDVDFNNYINILMNKLGTFNNNQILNIINLTKYYNKFVNNLAGALIENKFKDISKDNSINEELLRMKQRANTGKKYKLELVKNIDLRNTKSWGFY